MKAVFQLTICVFLLIFSSSCTKKSSASTAAPIEQKESIKKVVSGKILKISETLTGTSALAEIKSTYKGKVVLIDFWATWCPPCRAAMREIETIKPVLEEKGVVFVYLTSETSPESDWKQFVNNIAGEHYRLTNKQWQELSSHLGMHGIPAYMLLNKDGSEAFSNVTEGGYPGNETILHHIELALTK